MNEGRETVWFRRVRHRRKIFLLDVCSLDARQAVQPDPTHCSANPYGILVHPSSSMPPPRLRSIRRFRRNHFACTPLECTCRSKADGLRGIRIFSICAFKMISNSTKELLEKQFLVIVFRKFLEEFIP